MEFIETVLIAHTIWILIVHVKSKKKERLLKEENQKLKLEIKAIKDSLKDLKHSVESYNGKNKVKVDFLDRNQEKNRELFEIIKKDMMKEISSHKDSSDRMDFLTSLLHESFWYIMITIEKLDISLEDLKPEVDKHVEGNILYDIFKRIKNERRN